MMEPAHRTEPKESRLEIIEGGDVWSADAVTGLAPHPRGYTGNLPATGAWQDGDPVGQRQFATISSPDRPFCFESGRSLPHVVQAYETWGELNADATNAVLVCHALTGDSHVKGPQNAAHATEGWWEDMVGPGKPIDTDDFFVVCVNVLGGCQGSSGPASINPATGQPYGSSFPAVTIRDMVRAQAKVADHLGIGAWYAVVGGSMGGMQVLEWATMFPERTPRIAPIATAMQASALQIAWSAVGRMAVTLDPRWRGGEYYNAAPGDGPFAGLAIARAIAQIHYRSDSSFQDRFGRDLVDPAEILGAWDRFQVESYLDYHGEKLVRRFDANSYLLLNKAMDSHDLARSRGRAATTIGRIRAKVATASISTDTLYPPHQQLEIHEAITAAGGDSSYTVIEDPNGHDGFLLAMREVGNVVRGLLES